MHNFKELTVWKEAKDLSVISYKKTRSFPKTEMYGLASQMSRSAISIPSNIAEGTGRNSSKDFSRFIDIAIGSSFELETQLIISSELELIESSVLEELKKQVVKVQKMLFNFNKHLRK
jgi:four helix bundle protein